MANVLFLAYDPQQPSYRHRMLPLVDELSRLGHQVEQATIPKRQYVRRVWRLRRPIRQADLIVLSKLKLNFIELWLMRFFCRKSAYDVDDAIYLRRPKRVGQKPGAGVWRQMKFASMCRFSDLTICGNQTIAQQARRYSSSIEIIATGVPTARYQAASRNMDRPLAVVWVGLPGNLIYLEPLRGVFRQLAKAYPDFRLKIVSSEAPDWPDVPVEFVPWSTEAEVSELQNATAGIMPLFDDDWARGKCAFKLLQYMAAGLPCVASPVGANCQVVSADTGLLADTPEEWFEALSKILASQELAEKLGANGQVVAREQYDHQVLAKQYVSFLERLLPAGG